jgi:uncharacterized repeat protein (TIGR03803 family)
MQRFSLLLAIIIAGCSNVATPDSVTPQALSAAGNLPSGSGTYHVIYSFGSLPDGSWPTVGLAVLNGTLYGTTYGGGGKPGRCAKGCGTVYSVTTTGSENVLYRFGGIPDGAIPESQLTALSGKLYGTTFYGGKSAYDLCTAGRGCGTIFQIDSAGHESILYRFSGGADGSNPQGGLLPANGVLYGTTTGGLSGRLCAGQRSGSTVVYGTLFEISPAGKGYKILHSFAGSPKDGACPTGNLIALGSALYGVTFDGGANNLGTIFSIGHTGALHVLHSFAATEGDYPVGLVALNRKLYGAASADGMYNRGSLFSIDTDGKNFNVIYSFQGFKKGDGTSPYAAPVVVGSLLYGTTAGGGMHGVGTIYQLYRLNSPHPQECVVHSFNHPPYDGTRPRAPLLGIKNLLYGTTTIGGTDLKYVKGLGTVFDVAPPPAGCGTR